MIVLGRIVAPFGVGGWLRLHPYGDDPASWRRMRRCWLGKHAEGRDWAAHELVAIRPHGGGWIAKLGGVDDRSAAEAFAGQYLGAPREELPRPSADEHYWADLIGLAVVNEQGESLGKVDSLIETGANSVLVVRDGETERLVPYIASVIRQVDVTGERRILVDWGNDW